MKTCGECGGETFDFVSLGKAGAIRRCKACGAVVRPPKAAKAAKPQRNDAGYKRWKAAIHRRDRKRCQMPGCSGESRQLETHHIRRWADTPALRYDPANGIVLCYDCHHAIQDREDEYAETFCEIARRNAAADPRLKILSRLRKGEPPCPPKP